MHQSKQVHGIPNRSELIHLQYFSFEFYLQFSSFQIQRKPTFIYSVKIQSLQDLSTLQLQSRFLKYVVRSNLNQEFCNSLSEGILKVSVQCVCHHILQISVTEKILSTVSLFFEVNQSSSSSNQQLDRDLSVRQSFLTLSKFCFQIGLFCSKKNSVSFLKINLDAYLYYLQIIT